MLFVGIMLHEVLVSMVSRKGYLKNIQVKVYYNHDVQKDSGPETLLLSPFASDRLSGKMLAVPSQTLSP